MRDNQEMRKTNKDRDMDKYAEYMRNQVRELMTEFGRVDFLWPDYSYPGPDGKSGEDWQAEKLWKMVRELQPQIILNDRLIKEDPLSEWGRHWDFRTPEQAIPSRWLSIEGKRVPWETCQTLDGSWGYSRDEQVSPRYGWKTSRQLIRMLIEVVSKGGNLLLNVGPTGRGMIDERTMDRLSAIGHWMDYHGRSIYGCTAAPESFKTPENCLLTYNPGTNRLYVHILEWPMGKLHLEGFAGRVKYAQLLNDASEIRFAGKHGAWDWVWSGEEKLTLNLPQVKPEVEIPVIELILD
jgi:alpha-L-fucosidase